MSEYIFEVIEDVVDGDRYYPDERHDPMPVHEEIVRCRDCRYYNTKLTDEDDGTSWCCIHAGYAFEDDFCAWGDRKVVDE